MSDIVSLNITSHVDNLAEARQLVEDAGERFGCETEAVAEMVLAMNEAVTNIIVHGYQNHRGAINIEVEQSHGDFIVRLRDQARLYDPTKRPDPDINMPLHLRPYGGMGVYMMRNLVDELAYRTLDGGNELILVKREVCKKERAKELKRKA